VVAVWAYQRPGAQRFIEQTGITFPVGKPVGFGAKKLHMLAERGISWFPYEVVIDVHGKVRHASTEYDSTLLRRVLDEVVSETIP
jgi:hypothetical protein